MSILSTQRFREFQGFIEKVGEIRFNEVKHRQVNKFNNLLRKEGNITGVSTQLSTFSSYQAGRQAVRQAGCHLPWDSATSQAVSTISKEWGSLAASQAGSQTGSHLPRDSTSSQASSAALPSSTPARESPSQAGNNPSTQAGRQLGAQLGTEPPRLPKGIVLPPRQLALFPRKALNPLPPIGFPKGLPHKILTQSGSSTYPANL